MLLGTRSDWQAHLLRVHDELGFTAVRGHGILDDDMSVIIRGQYHFYNVDQVGCSFRSPPPFRYNIFSKSTSVYFDMNS